MNKKIFHTLFAPKINLPPKPKLVPVKYSIFTGGLSGIGGFGGFGASQEEVQNSYQRGFDESRNYYENTLNEKILNQPNISGQELIDSTINAPIEPITNNFDPDDDDFDLSVSQVVSRSQSRTASPEKSPTTSPQKSPEQSPITPHKRNETIEKLRLEEYNKLRKDPSIAREALEMVKNKRGGVLSPSKEETKREVSEEMDKIIKQKLDFMFNHYKKVGESQKKNKVEWTNKPPEKPPTKPKKSLIPQSENEVWKDANEIDTFRQQITLQTDDEKTNNEIFNQYYNEFKKEDKNINKQTWFYYKDLGGTFAKPYEVEPHNLEFANKVVEKLNKEGGYNLKLLTSKNIAIARHELINALKYNGYTDLNVIHEAVNGNLPFNLNKEIPIYERRSKNAPKTPLKAEPKVPPTIDPTPKPESKPTPKTNTSNVTPKSPPKTKAKPNTGSPGKKFAPIQKSKPNNGIPKTPKTPPKAKQKVPPKTRDPVHDSIVKNMMKKAKTKGSTLDFSSEIEVKDKPNKPKKNKN